MSDITIRIPEKVVKTFAGLCIGIGVLTILVHLWLSGFFFKKYHLKMFLPDAGGLAVGAPVRFASVRVGPVEGINIADGQSDNTRKVEVLLDIYERGHDKIRDGSKATLSQEGLLGPRYVSIRPGLNGAPIPSRGELQVVPTIQLGSKQFMESFGDLLKCLSREEQQKQGGGDAKNPSGSCPK